MSITGVFGLAGVGKSTYLSYLAAKALRGKIYERVYSSFPIQGCYELKWDKLGVEDYSNCLILIDEISLFCDNRNWKDNMSDDMRYFWIMYRHYNCDVIYCSQSYKDCDSKIRDRTDMLYRITKLPILPISRVRPVIKDMALNDSGQWIEAYVEKGLGTLVWRPKYYSMFDSFTCKPLKPNTSRLWADLSACPQLPQPPRSRRAAPQPQSRPAAAEPPRSRPAAAEPPRSRPAAAEPPRSRPAAAPQPQSRPAAAPQPPRRASLQAEAYYQDKARER